MRDLPHAFGRELMGLPDEPAQCPAQQLHDGVAPFPQNRREGPNLPAVPANRPLDLRSSGARCGL